MAETGNPIGNGKCPMCGASVMIRENKKGHLYWNCPLPEMGGCGFQGQCRCSTSDHLLAKKVEVWRCSQKRKDELSAQLPNEPPAPEDDPEPEELPEDAPPPASVRVPPRAPAPAPRRAAPAKSKSWWEREF